MELFQGAWFLRLKNRGRGGYLFADEDMRGVSLSGRRATHNTAWAVQLMDADDGDALVMLRNAAYGQYLVATGIIALDGHRGFKAEQGRVDHPEDFTAMWRASRRRRGSVVLRSSASGWCLRANGRYQRWHRSVTVGEGRSGISKMMHWKVQIIPLMVERPVPQRQEQPLGPTPPGGLRPLPQVRGREIRYIQADFNGNINESDWTTILFDGRSLTVLGIDLAHRIGNAIDFLNTTLCARAGFCGQLTPLLIDLPLSSDRMDIVVIRNGTPAHDRLRYPNVDVA